MSTVHHVIGMFRCPALFLLFIAVVVTGSLMLTISMYFDPRACAAEPPTPPIKNIPFELWLGSAFDHTGILHNDGKDTIFVYVNESWKKGGDEWRMKAIHRLGCVARTIYPGELNPPYDVEIFLLVPRPDGSVIAEPAVEGYVDKQSCAFNDFVPILKSTKETAV